MAPVFYLKSMMSGLNNQRIGVIGLIIHAARHGGKASLPLETVDFAPLIGRTPEDFGRLAFEDVYDLSILNAGRVGGYLTTDEPKDVVGLDTCFAQGQTILNEAISQSTSAHTLAKEALLAIQPASIIREHAANIVAWLPPGTMGLQLRIERDWHEYLMKKFGRTEIEDTEPFITVDAQKIAAKVARSGISTDSLWLCCDEADLIDSLDDIRADFRRHGFKVFFKSDLPEELQFPEKRLKRAFLEYAVCQRLAGYIGLSISTFTQSLWMESMWGGKGKSHYIYNSPGPTLLAR